MDNYSIYNLKNKFRKSVNEASSILQHSLVGLFKKENINISYEQWIILTNLVEEEGISQTELACKLNRDNSSITRIIDNMTKNELVERKNHDTDRRAYCIHLTEKGKKLQKELMHLDNSNLNNAINGISDEELETTISVLKKVINNLK